MSYKNRQQTKIVTSLATVVGLTALVASSALAAICVQNFTEFTMETNIPPIQKQLGLDANNSQYLTVDLGGTIENNASDGTGVGQGSASADTILSHEEFTFSCFVGDRTYYTDVLRLVNTSAESWDVTLTVEDDVNGNPATENGTLTSNSDVWLFASDTDVSGGPIATKPNPSSATLAAGWETDYIHLETVAGAWNVVDDAMGAFTLAAGEERQVAIVVDCDEAAPTGESGTFRITVEARR